MAQTLDKNMQLAVNSALRQRDAFIAKRMREMGMHGLDNKRQQSWKSFGYKEVLEFQDYYNLWERGGMAHGAIGRISSKCWQDDPEVIEGKQRDKGRPATPWEDAFTNFASDFKLWEKVKEVDLRRTVGHYAGLILQIADGKTWDQPVLGRAARRLVKLIPAWEGQLTPTDYDTDETSITFGEPKMWQFQESAVGDQKPGVVGRAVSIHPDRVIILGSLTEGVPVLRAAFNDFVNIEKVLGGSGESFLKNAARQLSIEFGEKANLQKIAEAHGVPVKELRKVFDEVTAGVNEGIDQTIITQNATVSPLVAAVPDPEPHFMVSAQSAAASIQLPLMIWIGSQTGERASTQDQADWARTCQGRRKNVLASDIETIVNHLMRLRLIPVIRFTVIWSDLAEATTAEKLANAKLMGEANQAFAATGEFPFSAQDAREIASYDPGGTTEAPLPEGDENGNDPAMQA